MRTRLALPLLLTLGIAPLTSGFLQIPAKRASHCDAVAASAETTSTLLGMWNATQPETDGDMVRFYYFHTGNIGLIRYGRLGLSYTRVFQWKILANGELALVFTKSGEHHRVRYKLDAAQRELHFPEDPVFSGEQTYTKRSDSSSNATLLGKKGHPLARIWLHETQSTQKTRSFRMYQLQPPTIDGRGVGWFHEGDMTEWSTETLTYRRTGDKLTLDFSVRNERHSTSIELDSRGHRRTLTLSNDPRNFWHKRTYVDGGPGFTSMLLGEPLPYRTPPLEPSKLYAH